MSLFVIRPFLSCASALFLFAAFAPVQAQSQSFTLTEPLQGLSGSQSFSVPNFGSTFGTLTDVTFTMLIDNRKFTIFNANDPAEDCVNLTLSAPGGSTKVSGNDIAAWEGSQGNFDISYIKPAGKSVDSMGIAGLLLYCTPKGNAAQYIDCNYTYQFGAAPEPGVKFLSAIAASAMVLMLVGRGLRQRAKA